MNSPEHGSRVAIVTGGTSGIGAEIVRDFVADGYRVLFTGRSEPRARDVIESTKTSRAHHTPVFCKAELTSPGFAERIVECALSEFGRVDVLVNNAGVDHAKNLLDVQSEEIHSAFAVNSLAPIELLIAVARQMKEQGEGGSIINITSRLALVGIPTTAVYGASKGALHSFTTAAAVELAPHKIRVNSVAPGMTQTALYDDWLATQNAPRVVAAEIAASIPLQRIAVPGDITGAVSYLASERSSYVTGICIPVDGGYTAK